MYQLNQYIVCWVNTKGSKKKYVQKHLLKFKCRILKRGIDRTGAHNKELDKAMK